MIPIVHPWPLQNGRARGGRFGRAGGLPILAGLGAAVLRPDGEEHCHRQAAAGAVLPDLAGGGIGGERDVVAAHRNQAKIDELHEIPPDLGHADPALVCDGLKADAKAAKITSCLPGLRPADPANVVNQAADRLERPPRSRLAEAAVGGTVQLWHLEPVIAGDFPPGGGGGSLGNSAGNSGNHGGRPFCLHAGPAAVYPARCLGRAHRRKDECGGNVVRRLRSTQRPVRSDPCRPLCF